MNLKDTLRYQSQVDLDHDGVIWFGGKDSNWIELDGIKKGDSAEVGFTRSEYSLAGIFNTKQFDLSHPIHFKGRYDLKDGSIIRIEIFGTRKDATAFPGDTASFKLEVIYPDIALTKSFNLFGKILLPNKGIDYNSARFLSADGVFTLRRGSYQTVEFHLSDLDIKLSDLKLPWAKGRLRVTGVLPQKGSESIDLAVANGTWVGQAVSVDGKIWNLTKDSSGLKVSAK